ncbi:MAG: bifunctional diaminohydroxyphosphoribosylaminopyrimidine deaminase/5-amino-6-(5-phosphoribosylamino)uracil reductase RibD [Actinomycetota bacterium]|nr:bifunctional diaminohydroxyphosphoribosylaminopyrimidine deaminase/5-amino-6-(5-phosphoribosylamino)uracil reductase RibD [Actinomycetota bacterium]
MDQREIDEAAMDRAIAAAATARLCTAPRPWVGAVVEPGGWTGATDGVAGPHAEVVALRAAGAAAAGATLYVTLEPCSHHGRTPPCVDAVLASGVRRVVVAVTDPDERVAGRGIAALREAGLDVTVGVRAEEVADQLAPYLHHRRTGRPWVVLKLAASLDARTAAPDGTSRWITDAAARADAHRLRAESGAVLVGAGTVRADDPELTVRDLPPEVAELPRGEDPLRVVVGDAPAGAKVHPCLEVSGDLGAILDDLGRRDIVQVLVEGGATTAGALLRDGLVDRVVLYYAPVVFGGDDAAPLLAGPGVATMAALGRGRVLDVRRLGDGFRVEFEPPHP